MDKMKMTQEQFEEVRQNWRESNGYFDASEEEKAEMDRKFDKVADSMLDVGDDSDGDTDETTDIGDKKMTISYSELENLKQKEREKNGYEYMSDEQKEYFDNNLEQKCDELFDIVEDTKDQDQIYESEDSNVKKLIR